MTDTIQEIKKRVEASREDIIKFMRDICRHSQHGIIDGPLANAFKLR